MSAKLLPDILPLLREGESVSACLTPEQIARAVREAREWYGIELRVEPQMRVWLTVTARGSETDRSGRD